MVSYAESSDDEGPFTYGFSSQARRRTKSRQVIQEDDEDEYGQEDGDAVDNDDEGALDFVYPVLALDKLTTNISQIWTTSLLMMIQKTTILHLENASDRQSPPQLASAPTYHRQPRRPIP